MSESPSTGDGLRNVASPLNQLFKEALGQRVFSGASLLVGNPDSILFEKTWGYTQWGGSAVDFRTRFDLASLTKPLLTATLCMHAIQEGRINIDDKLHRFFPSTSLDIHKSRITLRQLLNHSSGLPPYIPFYRELIANPVEQRPTVLQSKILKTPLISAPGKVCHYSDLGFILLGMILEKVFHKPLSLLASDCFQKLYTCTRMWKPSLANLTAYPTFRPMQVGYVPTDSPVMIDMDARPHSPVNRHEPAAYSATGARIKDDSVSFVATEYCPWRKRILKGEVHDENAYSLGGVAGHAGLFGTAREIFRLISFLWNIYRGSIRGFCSPEVVRFFWEKQKMDPESTWALGYDTPSMTQSSAGKYFSPCSVGHLGFTGTSFWMDLEREILIILLTNRVYPTRQNDKLKAFRPTLHNLIMDSFNV